MEAPAAAPPAVDREGEDPPDAAPAAAELLDYFNAEVPEVQLSLWLESRETPLHHYHVTVFDSADAVATIREGEAIRRFTGRLYTHIDHSSFISPLCEGWLANGRGVQHVGA